MMKVVGEWMTYSPPVFINDTGGPAVTLEEGQVTLIFHFIIIITIPITIAITIIITITRTWCI